MVTEAFHAHPVLPWVAAEKGLAPETGSALRPCVALSALSHLWILEEFLFSTGIINWQFITIYHNIFTP